jgi:hypothetical protein
MSTTLTAALLALAGVIAVVGVSYVFYLVGRAEDRDRAASEQPPEPEADEHPERNGHLARERRRQLPPRRRDHK